MSVFLRGKKQVEEKFSHAYFFRKKNLDIIKPLFITRNAEIILHKEKNFQSLSYIVFYKNQVYRGVNHNCFDTRPTRDDFRDSEF